MNCSFAIMLGVEGDSGVIGDGRCPMVPKPSSARNEKNRSSSPRSSLGKAFLDRVLEPKEGECNRGKKKIDGGGESQEGRNRGRVQAEGVTNAGDRRSIRVCLTNSRV